jgi:hypothetical protein
MQPIDRRSIIRSAFASAGLAAFAGVEAAAQERASGSAPISPKDNLKITKLETFLVKPRWLFLKVHTNAGIVGLGEPITEGRLSRKSSRTSSEKIRAGWCITGRRFTNTRFIAAVPF